MHETPAQSMGGTDPDERRGAAAGRAASRGSAWRVVRCPECRGDLELRGDAAHCQRCGQRLAFQHGVLRCVEQDAFYEEAYLNEIRHVPGQNRLKDLVFFRLLQSGVFGLLRDVLTPESVVLDVGCASGVRWLGNYQTIGVDLSFSSVRKTTAFYDVSVQANATRLPLASESVDVVYSSYFFEHMPPESKDAFLRELRRVMRPGARCVLLFDVLSEGPFGRFARRDPEAFRRGFIEPDGHVGLELLSSAVQRMERAELQVEQLFKFGTTAIQYMASYHWLERAYGDSVSWVRWLGRLAGRVSASRLRLPLELAITAFDTIINRYTLPDDATRAIVVARR